MKQAKYITQKKFIQKEEKLKKTHYLLLIGLMIFGVTYYYFIEPKTIGHDSRYFIYIFLLPTISGMLILGLYRWRFLINRFATNKGIVFWIFMTFSYLIQGFIFSYLSFGQVAKVSWDYFNNEVVKQNTNEILNCEITRFWTRKPQSIDFKFNNRHEKLNVNYATIKKYKRKNAKDYYLEINATKGLWNYYKVNEWAIKRK